MLTTCPQLYHTNSTSKHHSPCRRPYLAASQIMARRRLCSQRRLKATDSAITCEVVARKEKNKIITHHASTAPTQNLREGLLGLGLIEYSYHQVITSFPKANFQRTPRLSVFGLKQFQDGWSIGKFFASVHEWRQSAYKRLGLVCVESLSPWNLGLSVRAVYDP